MSQPRTVLILARDTLLEDEDGAIKVRRGGRHIRVPCSDVGERDLWHSFSQGIEPDQYRLLLNRLPNKMSIELLGLVDALWREGWITEQLRRDDYLLLTRTVISEWYEPAGVDPSQSYSLSRFALLRRGPEGLLLESPRSHARVTIGSTTVQQHASILMLGAAAGWDADPEAGAIIRMLVECRFLVPGSPGGTTKEDDDPTLRGWDFHDLLFHARSRAGRHRDPYGKVDPALSPSDPMHGVRASPHYDRISLPLADPGEAADPDMSFSLVLERRRSLRTAPPEPLTLATLSEFLFRSARLVRSDEASAGGSWRPFASAAGRDELVIYLSVHRCVGLESGLYRYDPADHALDRFDAPPGTVDRLARYCGTEPIGVHVIIAADFGRLNRRYRSLAYSLIMRNAGCLLQTMYLVATALRRAPCAIGAGDADLFARITGLPYEAQGSVADFVLR